VRKLSAWLCRLAEAVKGVGLRQAGGVKNAVGDDAAPIVTAVAFFLHHGSDGCGKKRGLALVA
jgi:hypothetical protein